MAGVFFENLGFSFGKDKIFDNLNLKVQDGEILGIVGPSGCGKTSLVRCLAGLLNPESGRIIIGDITVFDKEKSINIVPEKRNIGMVFQDYAVWPHKSVYQNVEYPLLKKKCPSEERKIRVNKALEQVRMSAYAQHMPVQLSGGQQQRVAIARALVSSQELIIMDEPITNLDAKLREEMIIEIKMLQKELNTTVIYITHDQEAALQLCDRIAIMDNKGQLIQIGSDEEIVTRPVNRFVYEFIGVSNFIRVDKLSKFSQIYDSFVQYLHKTQAGQGDVRNFDLAIRPMDIVYDNASEIRAKVMRQVFLGDRYDILLRLDTSDEVRMQANPIDICDRRDGQNLFSVGDIIGINFSKYTFYPIKKDN